MEKIKNAPQLRFSEFTDNWSGELLDNLTVWASGGTPSKEIESYWNGDIPWISASSMRGIQYFNSELKITELGLKNGSRLAKKGTLLLLVRGSMLFNKIPVGIAGIDVAFNQDVKSICCNESIKEDFLLYWFYASEHKILNMVVGTGIGAGKLDLLELKQMRISLPQISEQQKIADFLTSVDLKIQQLNKKKALLEQYKKGVMQQIFDRKIRFKDEHGNDYSDWEEKRLGKVSDIIMGQSPDSKSYNTLGDGKYLIQGNADIFNRKTAPRNWTNEPTKECRINDLILTVRAPVGAVAKSIHNACIGRGVCAIRSNERIHSEYIYQLLIDFETKWTKLEQGSTFTAVSSADIRNLKFNFPSKEEQVKIASFLSSIDQKMELVSRQLNRTLEFKKGLLQQMFV